MTFVDSVSWACTTITTVGYGDFYPVKAEGRVVGIILMLVGIGLLTLAVATWMIERTHS